jgi:hypothetical protein
MSKQLPRSVQEIADVIGRDWTLFLIGQLPRAYSACHPSGQVILYVPKVLKVDHPLVQLLGWKTASRLVQVFGGEILQPAHCADLYRDFRDRSIMRLLIEGHRPAILAEWFGVCDRHVRNLAREIPQEVREARVPETAEV